MKSQTEFQHILKKHDGEPTTLILVYFNACASHIGAWKHLTVDVNKPSHPNVNVASN
eukprot:m.99074 g.99074  ORF g.99074 m.99074 type:complete len:57 (-) comp13661_c1_seq3:1430-1600(-)